MNESRSLIKAGAVGLAAVGGGAALLLSAPILAAVGIVGALALSLVAGRMRISDSGNRTNSPSQSTGPVNIGFAPVIKGDGNSVSFSPTVNITQKQQTFIQPPPVPPTVPMVTVQTPLGKNGMAAMHCGHYPARDWRRTYQAEMRELRDLGYTFHGQPEVRNGKRGVAGVHFNTFFRKGQRRMSE